MDNGFGMLSQFQDSPSLSLIQSQHPPNLTPSLKLTRTDTFPNILAGAIERIEKTRLPEVDGDFFEKLE